MSLKNLSLAFIIAACSAICPLLSESAWAQGTVSSPRYPSLTVTNGITAGSLSLGNTLTINAPGVTGKFHTLTGDFLTVNARTLFNAPPPVNGVIPAASNWLGNDDGVPGLFGYGKFGQGIFLSGIGDVGVVGATRTTDTDTGNPTGFNRLSIGTMGWAFNFNTTSLRTAWAGYLEARRKEGAGQIHGLEINVTELGDGSDYTPEILPSAKSSGANAIYGSWSSGLNIAAGGNVRSPGGQVAWDGTQNVTQATDVGPALLVYRNGASFRKGIILSENAFAGCDGTGGAKTCTALEMGRGSQVAWIDGTTRQASRVWSDTSTGGNAMEMKFSDYGVLFHAFGGTTFQVVGSPSDVNGIQVFAGGAANAPARLVAAGSANASLGIAASGSGVIQLQSLPTLPNYTVNTGTATDLPACTAATKGGYASVTNLSSYSGFRNGIPAGTGTVAAPVFCTGSAWELH
jgi:hypothetical protein